jgi:hypothetical protein
MSAQIARFLDSGLPPFAPGVGFGLTGSNTRSDSSLFITDGGHCRIRRLTSALAESATDLLASRTFSRASGTGPGRPETDCSHITSPIFKNSPSAAPTSLAPPLRIIIYFDHRSVVAKNLSIFISCHCRLSSQQAPNSRGRRTDNAVRALAALDRSD